MYGNLCVSHADSIGVETNFLTLASWPGIVISGSILLSFLFLLMSEVHYLMILSYLFPVFQNVFLSSSYISDCTVNLFLFIVSTFLYLKKINT